MKNITAKIGLLPIACSRFKGMGKETPKTYEERIQIRLDEIEEGVSKFSKPINPGQIYTKEDLQKAMDLFYNNKIDFVFAFFLSWSEDAIWIRFLRDMYPVPVFFAHISPKITYSNTEEEDPFIEYLSTGGLVGTLEGSGAFGRFDRRMAYSYCGNLEEVLKELKSFSLVSVLRSNLKQTNFALMGNYPEIMWSTYCDPFTYFSKIGPELRFVSIMTLKKAYNAIPDKRVDENINNLLERYQTRNDIEMEHFKASVRCSLAIEDVAHEMNISTVVLNDASKLLFEQIGLRPGFYPTPENKGDVCVVPEGDLGVGLAVYILKEISKEHVNIIEPAYVEENGNVKVVHAGPNDYSDPQGKTIIARDIRFARSGWKHAGAPFAWYVISKGEKTLLHCSQGKDGKYKMVVTMAEGIPMEHELASYSHGCIKFIGNSANEVFKALIKEGVTQHYAIAPGDWRKELRYLANMLDFSYLEI